MTAGSGSGVSLVASETLSGMPSIGAVAAVVAVPSSLVC